MVNFDMEIVSYLVTQRSSPKAALRDETKNRFVGHNIEKTLGTPWPRVEEFLTGISKCSGQHCYVLKTAWFALTSPMACTKRSQSSRELSGRMMGGGFISGHDSLGTSSSWGRNSSSLARWRSRRNENGNVIFTLTKTNSEPYFMFIDVDDGAKRPTIKQGRWESGSNSFNIWRTTVVRAGILGQRLSIWTSCNDESGCQVVKD